MPAPVGISMKKLCVVIASREQPKQCCFLERATASIAAQRAYALELDIIIGIDAGATPPVATSPVTLPQNPQV